MLVEMAAMSMDDGLVLQIHAGAWRDHNPVVAARFGPDQGADIPKRADYVGGLKPLLDRFGNEAGLTVIVYTLDETTYSRELAPLAGHYPALRLGPPWWFFDSPEGIGRFYHSIVETAGFANTVGFNDDARSLLSIPARHDMARRCKPATWPGSWRSSAWRKRTRSRPPRTSPTTWHARPLGSERADRGAGWPDGVRKINRRRARGAAQRTGVRRCRRRHHRALSKTVRELWEEGGEAAYRYLESDVVLEVLRDDAPTVLAAPGGAVLDPDVRAVLADCFVVWLRTSPSTLAGRVRPGDHRPLLGDDPAETFAAMAEMRSELYREVATAIIDTDGRAPESIADEVVGLLAPRPGDG